MPHARSYAASVQLVRRYSSSQTGTPAATVGKSIDKFASLPQTAINLSRMLRAGQRLTRKKIFLSSLFVHHELPIRLAKRLAEIENLPRKLVDTDGVKQLRQDYLTSWQEVVAFPPFFKGISKPDDPTGLLPRTLHYKLGRIKTEAVTDNLKAYKSYSANLDEILPTDHEKQVYDARQKEFLELLTRIKYRHRADHVFMHLGLASFREQVPNIVFDHSNLQQFLDSFSRGRIGIRMLIGHQIAMMQDFHTATTPRRPTQTGIIDVECDIKSVVVEAWEMATEVAKRYYGKDKVDTLPMYEIRTAEDTPNPLFTYIPTILHHMLFELFKNSIRATMEAYNPGLLTGQPNRGVKYPPIRIILVGGNEDMIIKVSDQGRGIARVNLNDMESYMFSTAPPVKMTHDEAVALAKGVGQSPPFDDVRYVLPLAGFGYGIPISRLYAEYLGGSLELISMEGFGTDAYVYLERLGSVIEQVRDAVPGKILESGDEAFDSQTAVAGVSSPR